MSNRRVVKFNYYFDEEGKKEDRVRANFTIERGEVIEFVVQYETKIDDTWTSVVRYDTAHIDEYPNGHKDELHPDPTRNKKIDLRDYGVSSINDGLTYGHDDIKANWLKYKKKYLNRIKKP